jgi:primosomal protein N''
LNGLTFTLPQITQWSSELVERRAEMFTMAAYKREAGSNLKALHAKIEQQALEINFFAGALGRSVNATAK